ncbi:MAG: transcriptional repressor NrdR [Oligoflexia bacterium]|nr:transcriptional repressor NrdR [Oligoflexia bacterium]
MHCLNCNANDTKVIETRVLQDGLTVRRRRKCESCEKRFTTYEKVNIQLPSVVKHDGRREAFNKEKIKKGLRKACQKRPISELQLDQLVEDVIKEICAKSLNEVNANQVGNFIMEHLYNLDPVSYVRFASFYWEFDDINSFIDGLKRDQYFQKSAMTEGTISERTH